MSYVSAPGVLPDDSLLVAGVVDGVSNAIVEHLRADGLLDAAFGDSGTTWIDLPSTGDASPTVYDIATLEGGARDAQLDESGAAHVHGRGALRLYGLRTAMSR